tara:strand:- start:45 stop:488 length:444 start_codon:yes stop_codon:yes gene_type:complete
MEPIIPPTNTMTTECYNTLIIKGYYKTLACLVSSLNEYIEGIIGVEVEQVDLMAEPAMIHAYFTTEDEPASIGFLTHVLRKQRCLDIHLRLYYHNEDECFVGCRDCDADDERHEYVFDEMNSLASVPQHLLERFEIEEKILDDYPAE